MRSLTLCLTVLALVTACQGGNRPGITGTRPSPGAKVSTPPASAAPLVVRTLQKPSGNPRVLAGSVKLDAGYMASVSTGRPLADAYAVADAQLVHNNGANIISDNGAGIVSNNGGSLTSKVKWGLLAEATLALGRQLPIAGMALAVVGLADGKPLTLGVDADGMPAYVVYTDARGHFQVYLPEQGAGNVQVVAAVPDTQDARLSYGLVVDPAKGGEQRLTEETALTSDYVRNAVYHLFVDLTGGGDAQGGVDAALAGLPPLARETVKTGLAPFVAQLQGRDEKKITLPRRHRALRRFADLLVSRTDLAALQTAPFLAPADAMAQIPTGPALPALEAALAEVDERAAARLAADPRFFEGKPYVTEANFHRAAERLPAVSIRRPSDVGRFASEEYVGSAQVGRAFSSWALLVDLGLPVAKDTTLRTLFQSIFLGCLQQIFASDADQAMVVQALKQALDDEESQVLPEPVEATPADPPFPVPAEPAVTVGTLVGGIVGSVDGPASSAQIGPITALTADAAGHLYFTQAEGGPRASLRMVDLNAPDHPVTTLIGKDAAQPLGVPEALVFDPSAAVPTLYVGDSNAHRIYRVELPAGQPAKLVPLVGSGSVGSADGPGASASLEVASGLALDGKGHLYFTDHNQERVRRIDLAAPDHPVSTVVGGKRPDGLTPGGPKGALEGPRALAVSPAGEVFVAEGLSGRLWRLDADGRPLLVAGWSDDADFGDGYFVGAGFRFPNALTFDRDGSLLVAEEGSGRVRRVRLQGGAGLVTTVAGSGPRDNWAFADGPGTTARFSNMHGIAVGPDGTIYVGEHANARIRSIKR